jgi:hypothetical protein
MINDLSVCHSIELLVLIFLSSVVWLTLNAKTLEDFKRERISLRSMKIFVTLIKTRATCFQDLLALP